MAQIPLTEDPVLESMRRREHPSIFCSPKKIVLLDLFGRWILAPDSSITLHSFLRLLPAEICHFSCKHAMERERNQREGHDGSFGGMASFFVPKSATAVAQNYFCLCVPELIVST